ncbi:MAG: Fic family protein [Acholeplasmatales bacterium]
MDVLLMEKKHFEQLKKEVDGRKLKEVFDNFKVKYAYDAVHVEGTNSITLDQAFTLEKVSSDSKISELEQKELLNHIKAFEMVIDALERKVPMSEDFIKDVHQQVLDGIMPGGLYRQMNVGLRGSIHQPPDYVKVYDRMRRMMDYLDFEFKGSTIEKAAYIHLSISKIHPFLDGNGRLGRLMMNYYLMADGYLPISINDEIKEEYFSALDQFKLEKSSKKLEEIIKRLLLKRYEEVNKELEA